jgi:flagellar basal-body rod protein FlgB
MPGISLEDSATRSLVTALDGLATRQRTINNNIANIDTPGFKASDVSFAKQLGQALESSSGLQMVFTNQNHITSASPSQDAEIVTRSDTSQRLDGNNVDIEKEMTYLTETILQYQTAAKMVSYRLSMLRTVISEGRK